VSDNKKPTKVIKRDKPENSLQNGKSGKFTFDSSCSSVSEENSEDQAFINDEEMHSDLPENFSAIIEKHFTKTKNSKR
jgi:hypothetical protein